MMTTKEKIRNSTLAYVLGDAMGVPYEFSKAGTFRYICTGYGTHDQPIGTWSDDTSIMLCLLDALTMKNTLEEQVQGYKENLREMFYQGRFTVDGRMFDIGYQVKTSIVENFPTKPSKRYGNGCFFYSLPLAVYLLQEDDLHLRNEYFRKFVTVTHNNPIAISSAFTWSEVLREVFKGNDPWTTHENKGVERFRDYAMDSLSTHDLLEYVCYHCVKERLKLNQVLKLVIELGGDTDTNAALVCSCIGINSSKVNTKNIRGMEVVSPIVEKFLMLDRWN